MDDRDLYHIYTLVIELEEALKNHSSAKIISLTEYKKIRSELLFYRGKLKSKNIM